MAHHFTKTTTEAAVWCNKCGKETPWRVADGRRQYCIPCYDRRPDPANERFLLEERAAIIEFCGNVPREEAERMARGQKADQIRRDLKLSPLSVPPPEQSQLGIFR
jgi:hypothetical protein